MNTYTPDDVLVAADPGSLFRTQQTKALVMGASYANPEVSDHDIGTLSEAYNQVVTHYLEEGEWTHEETAEFMWDAFANVSAGTHKPQWTRISEEILGAREPPESRAEDIESARDMFYNTIGLTEEERAREGEGLASAEVTHGMQDLHEAGATIVGISQDPDVFTVPSWQYDLGLIDADIVAVDYQTDDYGTMNGEYSVPDKAEVLREYQERGEHDWYAAIIDGPEDFGMGEIVDLAVAVEPEGPIHDRVAAWTDERHHAEMVDTPEEAVERIERFVSGRDAVEASGREGRGEEDDKGLFQDIYDRFTLQSRVSTPSEMD